MNIKIISEDLYKYSYQIDEKIVNLSFSNKKRPEAICYIEKIHIIKTYLQNKDYCDDNTTLNEILIFMSLKNLMTIMVTLFLDEFIEMFRYYARAYIKKVRKFNENGKSYCYPYYILKDICRDESDIVETHSNLYYMKAIPGQISEVLTKIIDEEFQLFWIPKIRRSFDAKESLDNVICKIGIVNTLMLCYDYAKNESKDYLVYMANQFTINREIITYTKLMNYVLGNKIATKIEQTNYSFTSLVKEIVDYEYLKQFKLFVKDNNKELDIKKDKWKIYWHNGPSLNNKTYDFTTINSHTLRKEIKFYMKHRLNGFRNMNDVTLETINYALNYLTDNNKNIIFFSDISEIDVAMLFSFLQKDYITQFKKNPSITSIKITIKNCGAVVKYLCSKNRDSSIYSPIPKSNYFSCMKFKNLKKHNKRTDLIPEDVIHKIGIHIEDLVKRHQVMYNIFVNTPLRLKEVIYLDEDCISPSRYEGLSTLRYIPYKILIARRRKNLEDYQELLILTEVADMIQEQIDVTTDLRIQYECPYIFINKEKSSRARISPGRYFVVTMNKLIEKYSIRGESGEIYKLTSRQFRKRIVVRLIEDGASTGEIVYVLGHLSSTTAKDYYEEIREEKLAEMNTKFFHDKFDVIVSKENLNEFTEEERKTLYVDFRLNQRRVELGYCSRHFKDGPCNRRERQHSCADCEKLCTGKQYLSYWLKLRSSQKNMIDEFIQFYEGKHIYDYQNYREYERELYLLNCYENVVNKIQNVD